MSRAGKLLLIGCCVWAVWARAEIALEQRQSSTALLSESNRLLQNDLSLHPASLWLQEGQETWQSRTPHGGRSCQSCHGDVQHMKGVAPRYPQRVEGRLMTLEDRINWCRTRQQQEPAWPKESSALLASSAWVSWVSRGLPIVPAAEGPQDPDWAAGRRWFFERMGQIGLSCAQCHDERWGRKLAGVVIPQAHPTGYPLYRLEWQTMGSLQRRLRNCMISVRAEPFASDAPEWAQLELYLKWRARGMPLETPALRP
jgi:L-cysteine S-thiosulfotransferase